MLRKHPAAWLVSAAAVVFVLLGTGCRVRGRRVASRVEAARRDPEPGGHHRGPAPGVDARAHRDPAAHLLDRRPGIRSAPRDLLRLVVRADTGEVLFDRNAGTPARRRQRR